MLCLKNILQVELISCCVSVRLTQPDGCYTIEQLGNHSNSRTFLARRTRTTVLKNGEDASTAPFAQKGLLSDICSVQYAVQLRRQISF